MPPAFRMIFSYANFFRVRFQNDYLHLLMNNKLFISLAISLSVLMSCSSPKALEYHDYKNFRLESLGFGNSQVSLDVEYYNPNNFGLQLKRTELDIYVNNNFLGHSSLDTLIHIPRRDTFLLPIKFAVDMRNAFKNTWNTVLGKEVSIKVNGKVKIGKANVFMNMPINYEGKYKFSLF